MTTEGAPDMYAGIKSAKTWEELYTALDTIGGLRGSRYHYLPQELKDLIDSIRDGRQTAIDRVSRTGGLRDKVVELFNESKFK